jgi:hypothetical protein
MSGGCLGRLKKRCRAKADGAQQYKHGGNPPEPQLAAQTLAINHIFRRAGGHILDSGLVGFVGRALIDGCAAGIVVSHKVTGAEELQQR